MAGNREDNFTAAPQQPAPVDMLADPGICYIRKGEVEGKQAWLIVDPAGQTIGVAPSEAAALLAARDHGLDPFYLN